MKVTPSGISRDPVRLLQKKKAFAAILVMLSGRVMNESDLFYLSAISGISLSALAE